MTHKCKMIFSSVAPVAFPILRIAVSPRVSPCNCMHKKRGRRLLSKRWIAFITNWAFRRSQEDWGGNDRWWDYRCSAFSMIPLSLLNGGYWSISESSAFLGERAVTRQWRNDYWLDDVNNFCEGFPDGPVVKNFPYSARNMGSKVIWLNLPQAQYKANKQSYSIKKTHRHIKSARKQFLVMECRLPKAEKIPGVGRPRSTNLLNRIF